MWADEDVPSWWAGLGLPGLFDVHVHFLPPRMQRSVWAADFADRTPGCLRSATFFPDRT